MFAVKTRDTRNTVVHIPTNEIGVHSLRWGSAAHIVENVLVALYRGHSVELIIVTGENSTPTLNQLVLDRANEFVEVLQNAFASASFELLLSVKVIEEFKYDWTSIDEDADAKAEPEPEWLSTLINTVMIELFAMDQKYFPLIVAELCNPTVSKAISTVSKKTAKK